MINKAHLPVLICCHSPCNGRRQEHLKLLERGAHVLTESPLLYPEYLLALLKGILHQRKQTYDFYRFQMFNISPPMNGESINDNFVELVQQYLSDHLLDKDFGIEKLGKDLGMSRTNFFSRIKQATDMSPSRFVMKFRLEKAATLLWKNGQSISDIAYQVGFSSTAYFSKCFKMEFGKKPSEYAHKQNGRKKI